MAGPAVGNQVISQQAGRGEALHGGSDRSLEDQELGKVLFYQALIPRGLFLTFFLSVPSLLSSRCCTASAVKQTEAHRRFAVFSLCQGADTAF